MTIFHVLKYPLTCPISTEDWTNLPTEIKDKVSPYHKRIHEAWVAKNHTSRNTTDAVFQTLIAELQKQYYDSTIKVMLDMEDTP